MKHGKPKEKKMGVLWESTPQKLTSAELEVLSEDDRSAYWAHVSVHAADHSARYARYGLVAFVGAVAALVATLVVLVWVLP